MGKNVDRRRRRGRDILLWTGGLFLLIQITAGVLIDRCGLRIRFPYAAKALTRLQEASKPPQIITFGSSRTGSAIFSSILEVELHHLTGDTSVQVFQAAVPGGDLTTTDFLLEQILKMGVRPRLAVIEISPENLATHNHWMTEHVRRQVTWANTPSYLFDILWNDQLSRWLRTRFVPLSIHRYQICAEAERLWREGWQHWSREYALDCGWSTTGMASGHNRSLTPEGSVRLQTWTKSAQQAPGGTTAASKNFGPAEIAASRAGAQDVYRWLRNYHIGGLPAASLERVLQRCQEHDILPLFVLTPIVQAQREVYTPEIEQAFRAHLDCLRARYLFYVADYRDCLADHYLMDNHHLTEAGGAAFSTLFAREVLVPQWRDLLQRHNGTAQLTSND